LSGFRANCVPKYFVGKYPERKPNILVNKDLTLPGVLKKNVQDLSLLIWVHEASMKRSRIFFILFTSLRETAQKSMISSTNCWWVIGRLLPQILNPLIFLSLRYFFIYLPSPSAAMINKKGDRGSPCLSPYVALNIEVGIPFRRMEKFGVAIISCTQ